MSVDMHHISKAQILLSIILILGLVALVYLAQRQQIFKPKAENNIYDNFEVTDPSGSPLPYQPGNQRVYNTDNLDIKIKVKDLNGLVP